MATTTHRTDLSLAGRRARALAALAVATTAAGAVVALPSAADEPTVPADEPTAAGSSNTPGAATDGPTADSEQVEIERTAASELADGVRQETFRVTTPEGASTATLLAVDLDEAETDLLTGPTITTPQRLDDMAGAAGAIAAVNGDFFQNTVDATHGDISATFAAVGVEIRDGEIRQSAVPYAQRHGEGLDREWNDGDEVVGVTRSGHGVVTDVSLDAFVTARGQGRIDVDGLNQYGMATDEITIFDARWGDTWGDDTRARAACGDEVDRGSLCTDDVLEVLVEDGRVVELSDEAGGTGALGDGQQVLLGREDGADELRALEVGDRVNTHVRSRSDAPGRLDWAIGGAVVVRDGVVGEIPERPLNPRTLAGVSRDGGTLHLVSVDGRNPDSVGISTRDAAVLMDELGSDDAVLLDGGGSTTMIGRPDLDSEFSLLSRSREAGIEVLREVPNGIGVFPG
ncbi:phosphodiester glycosidase family protein [Georgenia sp. Z1344]|uniref:phosphodiester glycosidase family protein n=1 Tax=Georgenia sp. Z1344 TaxID=3416706 RepID=UPI003CEC5092